VISGQASDVPMLSARPDAQPSTPPASVNARTGLVRVVRAAWTCGSGTGVSYDPRFSEDRFGVLVTASAEQAAPAREALHAAGAEEVRVA